MAGGEGRLGRWSRLKQKDGADDREERDAERMRAAKKQAVKQAEKQAAAKTGPETTGPEIASPEMVSPEIVSLPGGVRVRNFVPAMAPLAPEPEADDDRLTRGIGHAGSDEEDPDIEVPEQEAVSAADAPEITEIDADEEQLTKEQNDLVSALPPLESLTGDSDFTPFMEQGVPELIKRKAMRILWRANPLFGVRDGLNDYDEDFNIVHKILTEGVGAYQVGRGHLSEKELRDMMPENARRLLMKTRKQPNRNIRGKSQNPQGKPKTKKMPFRKRRWTQNLIRIGMRRNRRNRRILAMLSMISILPKKMIPMGGTDETHIICMDIKP